MTWALRARAVLDNVSQKINLVFRRIFKNSLNSLNFVVANLREFSFSLLGIRWLLRNIAQSSLRKRLFLSSCNLLQCVGLGYYKFHIDPLRALHGHTITSVMYNVTIIYLSDHSFEQSVVVGGGRIVSTWRRL